MPVIQKSESCYFFTVTKFSSPVQLQKCKKVFCLLLFSQECEQVVPGTGVLLPHTKLHTSLIVVGRAVFLSGGGDPSAPLVILAPSLFTLVHSTFHSTFQESVTVVQRLKKPAEDIFLFASTISFFFSFTFFGVVRVWKLFHLALRRKFVSKTG